MKKTFIFILGCLFFITGCGEIFNKFDVEYENIISIHLNNEIVSNNKFQEVDKVLEKIEFSSKKIKVDDEESYSELIIKTDTESYLMKIYNNDVISFLDIDNKMYYAKDKKNLTELITVITKQENADNDEDTLVNIEYSNNYSDSDNENDIIVDLEPTLEAYKLTFDEDIDKLIVYATKYENDTLNTTDILYERDNIKNTQSIIIKTNTSESIPKILIYVLKGEITEIITPKYNGKTNEITFDKIIKKDNS